ncbi:electron transport complex subunit RsxD [Shewanella waksmanii]|uniref:electron transport complex subunit RsxD n=1 Tax=Shewanella waksmanii TaxID=213783 RepID=UPI003736D785
MAFKIASSPHLSDKMQTSRLMQQVMLCALPGLAVQCYFFGWGTLIQVVFAMLIAWLAEALVLKIRNRPTLATLKDNSALLTGFLLGLAVPAFAPWWIIFIGVLFAIIIVKQLYGGLGNNIFNPAMAAYVMLLIAFPLQMTTWSAPIGFAQQSFSFNETLQLIFFGATGADISQYQLGIDGMAMATPLDSVKTAFSTGLTINEALLANSFSDGLGVGWFWINCAYFIGGLIMIKLKLIRWHISVAIIASLFICASIGYLLNPDTHLGPIMHLFSGATMLAAFFIATDPVSAATSNQGRLIFGTLIGVIVYVIRTYGGYPDAFAFAVLLGNLCAPFIDHYVKPRAYGHRTSR